jgi:AAHS family 4-hydroxybenzoate transporter-like MFS transporter
MQGKTVDITTVIDSAQFIGLPLRVTVLTFLIMLVDGFDLQTMSFVAPELVTEWGVERALLGPVLTASMIGMALGSVVLGWLGDRIGRKSSYTVCIAFLFVGSLLSAYSTGLWDLFAYRFITGIGLGGITPLAATLISEWTAKKVRGVAVACVVVAVPLGGMVGAAVAQLVIPSYGWRTIFFIGAALPFVFFTLAWFLLPESPKYLLQRPEKHPQLAQALNRLLKEQRFDGTENFIVDEPPAPPGNWLATLLKPPYRATTLLLWAAFSFNTLGLYAFVNWLPTVLTSTGLPREAALQGLKLFNFGGFFGAVGGALLIGLYGSRIVGSSLALVGAIATFLIGITMMSAAPGSAGTQLFLLICIAGMALNGMQTFLYAVGAHSYPTYIRASGVGCAQAISRIGGVMSSVVGSAFFAMGMPVGQFFYILAGVIVVVVISFFCLRTHMPGGRQSRELEAQALREGAG